MALGLLATAIQTWRQNECVPTWKRGSETVIFRRWHRIVRSNPSRRHRKTPRLNQGIWQSSRIQKLRQGTDGILNTNDVLTERVDKKALPFTIAAQKSRYRGINVTKKVKDLVAENRRKLSKEMEEDIKPKKWKHIPWSWSGRRNITKMPILPKASYRFKAIPTNIPGACFTQLEQLLHKFIWNQRKTPKSHGNLEEEGRGRWDHSTAY